MNLPESYPTQISKKEKKVRAAFSGFGAYEFLPTVTSEPLGFRNRAKMVVTGTSENPVIGLGGEVELDQGREILNCPIHHPKLNKIISALPSYIREYNLIPYRIADREGELKAIILFYSSSTDELYVRFILRSKECVSRIRKLLPRLQEEFPMAVVVSANIQPIPHAILEGPEEIILSEETTLNHRIGGYRFRLNPQAFVQTNSGVATKLYTEAARWIRAAKVSRLVELFCGQGAFSFFAADGVSEILGVDTNAEGVSAANESAKEQGLNHIHFKAADAGLVQEELTEFRPDLILVNPPRRGLGGAVDLLLKQCAPRVIYSSCSLDSLMKDLERLSVHYQVERVQVFDMFPHTDHFEVLVSLVRWEA